MGGCQSHQPSVLFFHELFHAALSLCCKVRIWHEHLFWPGRGRLRDVKGIQAAGVFLDPTFDELGKVNYSFWVLYEDIRRYPFDQYLIMAVNFWSWTKDYSLGDTGSLSNRTILGCLQWDGWILLTPLILSCLKVGLGNACLLDGSTVISCKSMRRHNVCPKPSTFSLVWRDKTRVF